MRIFRLVTTLAGALLFSAVLPAASVSATPVYPPAPPHLTVSSTTVALHGTDTIHGTGFTPGETIDITETSRPNAAGAPRTTIVVPAVYELATGHILDSLRANPAGAFTDTIRLDQPGWMIITATGRTSGVSVEVTVRVLASTSGGGTGGLPRTGDDTERVVAIGGTLIALGVIVVLLTVTWRRRASRRAAPGGIG